MVTNVIDPTDARRIVRDVARAAGVDPDAVLGRDRTAPIVAVRRRAIVELRAAGCSYAGIGRLMGRTRQDVAQVAYRVAGRGRCNVAHGAPMLDACRRST